MENNNLTLSDVERNKELFEYEMTEVILQLKGEFAEISGKDLQLDGTQFVTQKLNLQADIPEVAITPAEIELTTPKSISADAFGISKVHTEYPEVDCPSVPVSASVALDTVQLKPLELDCPAVSQIDEMAIKEVKVVFPTIPKVNTNTSCKGLPTVMISPIGASVSDVAVKVPSPKAIQVNQTFTDMASAGVKDNYHPIDVSVFSEINIQDSKIDIPDTAVNLSSSIMEISSPKTIQVNQTFMEMLSAGVRDDYHPIDTSAFSEISIQSSKIDVPHTAINLSSSIDVQAEVLMMELPAFQEVNCNFMKFIQPPILEEKSVEQVKIPDISLTSEIPAITVDLSGKKSETTEIHVPVVEVDFMKETKINVEQPNVNFEYPIAGILNIPPVTVSKMDKILIPEKMDFSNDIQEIIKLAV